MDNKRQGDSRMAGYRYFIETTDIRAQRGWIYIMSSNDEQSYLSQDEYIILENEFEGFGGNVLTKIPLSEVHEITHSEYHAIADAINSPDKEPDELIDAVLNRYGFHRLGPDQLTIEEYDSIMEVINDQIEIYDGMTLGDFDETYTETDRDRSRDLLRSAKSKLSAVDTTGREANYYWQICDPMNQDNDADFMFGGFHGTLDECIEALRESDVPDGAYDLILWNIDENLMSVSVVKVGPMISIPKF